MLSILANFHIFSEARLNDLMLSGVINFGGSLRAIKCLIVVEQLLTLLWGTSYKCIARAVQQRISMQDYFQKV